MTAIKASVFIATSLDGFIARRDGGLDWLDAANATVPEGEDCGYGAFIETVDVLVMGRFFFEKVLSFGAWPYKELPVVFLSRAGLEITPALRSTVSTAAGTAPEGLQALAGEGYRHAYIDGGKTIQGFLAADLVDDLVITVIPVLIGDGIGLFGPLQRDGWLTADQVIRFPFGFVQTHYRLRKSGADR